MHNPFTKHPKSVNETYFEHMWCAIKFAVKLECLSFTAIIHAVFPFLFEHTASEGVEKLNSCLKKRNKITTNEYGDDDWATPQENDE